MLPSPFISSPTTPFSVKDILKLELQQQSQQHQLQFISCLGFSGALSQSGGFPNNPLRSHSPPSCMLAGRDSPSPISSGVSEGDDRMSYMNAQSELPVDVFGASAETQPAQRQQQLEAGREEQDHSKRQYFQPKPENNSDFCAKLSLVILPLVILTNIQAQRNSCLRYICMIVAMCG